MSRELSSKGQSCCNSAFELNELIPNASDSARPLVACNVTYIRHLWWGVLIEKVYKVNSVSKTYRMVSMPFGAYWAGSTASLTICWCHLPDRMGECCNIDKLLPMSLEGALTKTPEVISTLGTLSVPGKGGNIHLIAMQLLRQLDFRTWPKCYHKQEFPQMLHQSTADYFPSHEQCYLLFMRQVTVSLCTWYDVSCQCYADKISSWSHVSSFDDIELSGEPILTLSSGKTWTHPRNNCT